MRLCLMIEGQEDVTWDNWCALAQACEDSGMEGMFRSDHYLSVQGHRERGSLDAWTTLAGLAAMTERIMLGTLVSPATFRHPSVIAKSVVTVDHISAGRVELGLGAGWHETEHRSYGFDFPPTPVRIELLAEQLEIVHGSWTREDFNFVGRHYEVQDLNALPKPVQTPHPNLIVGGSAGPRTASLAAKWADEYNTVLADTAECSRRREIVSEAWRDAGRNTDDLVFSLMTGCVVGTDDGDVRRRAQDIMAQSGRSGDPADWLRGLSDEWVVGTVAQVVERLGRLSEAGVDRVMLQHQSHEDVDMVHVIGTEVAPQLSAG